MYDKLIKGLRMCEDGGKCDLCPKWLDKQNGGLNACTSALSKEAADAIEELQKRLDNAEIENIKLKEEFAKYRGKNRWIPVTERLPEPQTDVLAAWDNGEVWTVYQWWAEPKEGEDPLEYDDDIFYENGEFYSTKKRVTHWMPLPQPPENGEA